MDLFDDFLDDEVGVKKEEPVFPWDNMPSNFKPATAEKPAPNNPVIVGEEGEPESTLDVFSNSKLECFQRCPLKFRFKYIDGHQEPKGGALLLGGAVHAGAEHAVKEMKKPGNKGAKNFGVEAAMIHIKTYSPETELSDNESFEEIERIVKAGVEKIHDEYIMKTRIYSTEETWTGELKGIGKAIGIIDVIEGDPGAGGAIINPCVSDYKTSKYKYEDGAILRSTQLAGYSFMKGIMRVKYVVILKQKDVKIQILDHIYTDAERMTLFGNMALTWRRIQAAIKSGDESMFPPAIFRGFGSPCDYCKLQGLCEKTLHDMGKKYFG